MYARFHVHHNTALAILLLCILCCNCCQGGCGTSDTWNSGDFVRDTPAVNRPNRICAAVDSCSDTQSPDAVQNYMVGAGSQLDQLTALMAGQIWTLEG
jgi:hypothetical protein